jgi:AraC-like DNA-binding protein
MFWGRLEDSDVAKLIELLTALSRMNLGRYSALVDCSRVDVIPGDTFVALLDSLQQLADQLAVQLERQAIIHPAGLQGAVVAGLYRLVQPSYPVEVFGTLRDASSWLLGDAGVECEKRMNQLWSEVLATRMLVPRLREVFARDLVGCTLESCAQAMDMAPRTLQRRLKEAGTTFVDELTAERVRAAKELLIATNDQLTAIAIRVGYANLQHFSGAFRRETGKSPSAWRASHRRGATAR